MSSPSKKSNPRLETMRIPAVHLSRIVIIISASESQAVGAGCLVDNTHILTTLAVVQRALGTRAIKRGQTVVVSMAAEATSMRATVVRHAPGSSPLHSGMALLEVAKSVLRPEVPPAEFASPLKYEGQEFMVVTFPPNLGRGITDGGQFQSETSNGTIRMGPYKFQDGGFGGSPIFSPELDAFVGLVSGLDALNCIPSAYLSGFYPELAVKFRVPQSQKPQIKNVSVDDPNVQLFGTTSDNHDRRLSATMEKRADGLTSVKLTYEILPGSPPPRGRFVTFITYPDMDEYELFTEVDSNGKAEVECRPRVPDFTVAAIGDGGETRLTLNLAESGKANASQAGSAIGAAKTPPANEAPGSAAKEEAASTTESAVVQYRSTYAAFASDLVAFDDRRADAELTDSLKNEGYAKHLAQLLMADRTPLPLSLGLFGDWGSGKSYFMRLLHREIKALEGQTPVFCGKVVQIHFNAWHYLDTNLWANLVCEIFDSLFAKLSKRPDTKEKVEALKKELAEKSALAAEAKKALDDAKKGREAAEKKLQYVEQKRQKQEQTVAAFIDDLTRVASDASREQLRTLANGFGLNRLNESFSELEARAIEARSLGGRFRTLGLALLSPEGRGRRLTLLFAALLIPVALAFGVPWLLGMKDQDLAGFTRTITAAVTLLGTAAAWISSQTKRGAALLNTLETTYESVKKSREKVRKEKQGATEQLELDKYIKDETNARHALNEAQAKVRAIESELRDLAPGRRLLQFLEHRSGATDYRQHLGLVSLVRRDFEQLSRLLQEGEEFKEGDQPMLDRIVLYIDDLDRCKSARVIEVLEAVHLLLAFPIFAVVVAVDPRWLRKSLVEHYPTLLAGGRKEDGTLLAGSRESLATPQDFLEKIFQVPFQLQRLEEPGFGNLVTELLPIRKQTAGDKGKDKKTSVPPKDEAKPPSSVEDKKGESLQPGQGSANELKDNKAGQLAAAGTAAGATVATGMTGTPIPPKPAPIAPERLELEGWEHAAVKLCHPLFRTPRAVKRLANTYCLIRTGVEASAWAQFLGSEARPGEHRTPLLMLGVAAAYPGLASRWLDNLLKAGKWEPVPEMNLAGDKKEPDAGPDGWDELKRALELMKADTFAPFDKELVKWWVPKVKRYSF